VIMPRPGRKVITSVGNLLGRCDRRVGTRASGIDRIFGRQKAQNEIKEEPRQMQYLRNFFFCTAGMGHLISVVACVADDGFKRL